MNKKKRNSIAVDSSICGIFGTGRSGSTWLGSILNSHPGVIYRFEPFHRLKTLPEFAKLIPRIRRGDLNREVLEEIYRIFKQANPATDKPPFFEKNNGINTGRKVLWPIARKLKFTHPLFALVYTPSGNSPLVFKEVDLETLMVNMLNHTSIPITYLIRHPFGVVSSLLEGQAKNLMGTGRVGVIESLMQNHDPMLAKNYSNKLDTLSPAQLNTLLWRMDVEKAWYHMNDNQQAQLLFYEDLCIRTEGCVREVFEHFNIEFEENVRAFILKSTKATDSSSLGVDEVGQKSYFSVYRDPISSMNKWKENLDKSTQEQILGVLEGSEAVESYFSYGHWET